MQRLIDYQDLWLAVKRIAPKAILLRAPEGLDSHYRSAGGDLDILVESSYLSALIEYLRENGFVEEYSPQSFRRTLTLREISQRDPYTIDLYLEQRWGLGFRCGENDLVEQITADFLRATFDRKGKQYFELKHPEGLKVVSFIRPNSFHRVVVEWLWKWSFIRLLSLYMVVAGKVEADWKSIIKSLRLVIAHQVKRIFCKRGLEAALIGIDGAGKSSLTLKLTQLPLPVSSIYMGSSQFTTFIMRAIDGNDKLLKLHFIGYHLEMLSRRLRGRILSHRGWVVIYDRHPIEPVQLEGGLKKWLNNRLTLMYNWKLDRTYWLTGDIQQIHKRKAEHSLQDLEAMDHEMEKKLLKFSVPFKRLDSTFHDLEQLYKIIGNDLVSLYQCRTGNGKQIAP